MYMEYATLKFELRAYLHLHLAFIFKFVSYIQNQLKTFKIKLRLSLNF